MKRRWLIITLAVIYLIAFTGSVFAWTSETEGRPFRFASGGGATGYYVWQDEHGFHVWMLPAGGSHTFTGTIRTDGRLFDVRGHQLDGGESFQAYPDIRNRFWFEALNPASLSRFVFPGLEAECDSHKIFFKLNASDGSEGIHFDVSGASYVAFELLLDGHGTARQQIWYGGSSWHPETHVFKFENK